MSKLNNIMNNLFDLIILSMKYGVEILREKIEFWKLINESNDRERKEE